MDLKFRAWDSELGFMVDPGFYHIGFRGDIWFNNTEGGGDSLHEQTEKLKVMQFTGLKDKNGVEIFEGDIVVEHRYPFFDNGVPNYRATVEWIFAGFQTVLHCVNPEKRGISDGINTVLEDGDEFEVIGNIHENQDLME